MGASVSKTPGRIPFNLKMVFYLFSTAGYLINVANVASRVALVTFPSRVVLNNMSMKRLFLYESV